MTTESDGEDFYGVYYLDYSGDIYGLEYPEMDAERIIYIYVSPFLLFFGTIGNFFSLIIMYKLSHEVFSTCIYLSLLAVVDILVLYTRCGNDWLSNVSHIDLSNMLMVSSESICKVYPFIFNFIFHLSKWLMVCLAIEGFIATKYPEKFKDLCSLSRAKAVVLFLTVLLICINIHYFWSYELISLKEYNGWFCTFTKHGHQHSEAFQEVIWPILDLLVAEVIPYLLVIICGAFIITQILNGNYRGNREHQKWRDRYQMNPQAMDQLKVTILIICIFFLLLTLPKFAYVIFKYLVETHELLENSLKFDAQQMLAHAVCATLEHIFLSSKFFLYFASSSQFRKECKRFLQKCCCRCRNNSDDRNSLVGKSLISPTDSRHEQLNGLPSLHNEYSPNVDNKSLTVYNFKKNVTTV